MLITAGMLFIAEIRIITMIDRTFWQKVAEEWRRTDDGIKIPDIGDIDSIDPEETDFYNISDSEIDDILKDF